MGIYRYTGQNYRIKGMSVKIWVDADACTVVVRDILFRASQRTGVEVTLVVISTFAHEASVKITMLQSSGFDVCCR